jgi:hypothetical protein
MRLKAANSKAQGNALGPQTDRNPNQGPTGRNPLHRRARHANRNKAIAGEEATMNTITKTTYGVLGPLVDCIPVGRKTAAMKTTHSGPNTSDATAQPTRRSRERLSARCSEVTCGA